MMHILQLSLVIFSLLLPRLAAAQQSACPQFFPGGQTPTLVNERLAPRTTLLCNDAFASLASGQTHGALWSAEHPTAGTLAQARQMPRHGEFHADDRLPPEDAAQLSDYKRSGYDRGHLTPSGDMPDDASQQQSFSLANMVPQSSELNRGIWEGVETIVRHLTVRDGDLYVVTGPAFRGARVQSIGADGVLVPTSTWKAIYDPSAGGTGVYVCKKTEQPTCDVVSVMTLIHVVGIDPFPTLPQATKTQAMALPEPGESRYASEARRRHHVPPRSLLDQFLASDVKPLRSRS